MFVMVNQVSIQDQINVCSSIDFLFEAFSFLSLSFLRTEVPQGQQRNQNTGGGNTGGGGGQNWSTRSKNVFIISSRFSSF